MPIVLKRCEHCGGPLPDADGVTFDDERRIVARNGLSVRLSRHEMRVVRMLSERPGRMVRKTFIEDELWGLENESPSSNHVSVLLSNCRRKLRKLGIQISTIWGEGYVWGDTVERVHMNGKQVSYKPKTTFGDMRKAS